MTDRTTQIFHVNLRLGERSFSLRLPAHDEALVREAARLINERIDHYKQEVPSEYDCLAMILLDTMVTALKMKNGPGGSLN